MTLSATAITEVDAFTANIYPPAQGTVNDASDVLAGLQAFANRTRRLINRSYGTLETDGAGNVAIGNNNGGLAAFTAAVVNAGAANAVRISWNVNRPNGDYGVIVTMKGVVASPVLPTYGGVLINQVDIFFHDVAGAFIDPAADALEFSFQVLP